VRSRWGQALRTPVGLAASIGLVAIIVLAIVGPILWSDDAARLDILNASQGASREHPLGTDALGRDILYRVLVATRLSVTLAVLAAGLGAVIGIPGVSYLTALHNLVTGKSSTATQVIAVAVFVLIDFLLIIIPFAFLELRPEATKALLKHTQDWLLSHAVRLMAAIALLLGAYLAVSGLVRLS